jgi:shikimate kinase
MKRVLLTGMSGTGKSTVSNELAACGYKAVDTDDHGLSEWVAVPLDEPTGLAPGQDWVWREDRIQELLSSDDVEVLFLSGCSPNQGKFYPQFDHIVLLTAPAAVLVARLATGRPIPTGSIPMRSLGSLPCSKRSSRCCEVAQSWRWTPALPSTRSWPPSSGWCSHHQQLSRSERWVRPGARRGGLGLPVGRGLPAA